MKLRRQFWTGFNSGRLGLIAATTLLQWSFAYALDPATDDEFASELPVVLSASRLYQPLSKAPSAVTVIDRAMIDASGARSIPDLFRLVPGFQVGYVNGSWQTVARGVGDAYARQMQVLIDGRSVYSALYGGVEWSELPIAMEDIERVEVVRGANAASFGANSFLGVINIITREPAVEHNDQVVVTAGDRGVLDATVRKVGGSDGLRYRLTASSRGDSGFAALHDASRINLANLRANYQLSPTDQIEVQLGLVSGKREQGYPRTASNGPRDMTFDNGFLQGRWTRRETAEKETWLQYSFSERDARERLTVGVPQTMPFLLLPAWPTSALLDYSNLQRRHDVEVQHNALLAEGWRLTVGGQVRQDSVRSRAFFGTDDWLTSNLFRVFGHLEWRPSSQWTINAGTMYEKTSMTGGAFSPRLAINWEAMPGHTFRASWSRAERTPSLLEARWNQTITGGPYTLAQLSVPSDGIKAESADTREVAYVGDFSAINLSLDIRLYEDRLHDLIAGATVPYYAVFPFVGPYNIGSRTWINQYQATLRGAELATRWRPWESGWIYFSTGTMSISSDASSASAGAPEHNSALLMEQSLGGGWSISAGYYRVGTFKWQGGSKNPPQPGYDKLDLRLARSFLLAGRKGEVALVTQNVDGGVYDYFESNIPLRTTYLRLDLPF